MEGGRGREGGERGRGEREGCIATIILFYQICQIGKYLRPSVLGGLDYGTKLRN